jgi:uncharacterized protein YggE
MDVATTTGAVRFYGPQFSLEEDGETRREALEEATREAVLNAEAIARGLGVQITGFTSASMTPEQAYPLARMSTLASPYGGAGGGSPTPVEVREVEIAATIYVTARYE